MKRVWIAIIFLAISAGLCVGEQMYTQRVYNDLNDIIAKTQEYDNYEDISDSVDRIKDYWDEHNDLLFAIMDSQAVNELGQAIITLNPDDSDFSVALEELKMTNRFFYRNQRVTLANIF